MRARLPVTMLAELPYFLVLFLNDNPFVVAIMSSCRSRRPSRCRCAAVALIAVGVRVYENSLLRLGARMSWREALSAS